jgi:hypothetical protein
VPNFYAIWPAIEVCFFLFTILLDRLVMNANGPAIWGGCVTRRQHRQESVPVGQKIVTVQGGYGVVFAFMVQILKSTGGIAVPV